MAAATGNNRYSLIASCPLAPKWSPFFHGMSVFHWHQQEVGGRKNPDIKLCSADDGKSILSRFRFGPQSFSTSVLSTQIKLHRTELAVFGLYKQRVGWHRAIASLSSLRAGSRTLSGLCFHVPTPAVPKLPTPSLSSSWQIRGSSGAAVPVASGSGSKSFVRGGARGELVVEPVRRSPWVPGTRPPLRLARINPVLGPDYRLPPARELHTILIFRSEGRAAGAEAVRTNTARRWIDVENRRRQAKLIILSGDFNGLNAGYTLVFFREHARRKWEDNTGSSVSCPPNLRSRCLCPKTIVGKLKDLLSGLEATSDAVSLSQEYTFSLEPPTWKAMRPVPGFKENMATEQSGIGMSAGFHGTQKSPVSLIMLGSTSSGPELKILRKCKTWIFIGHGVKNNFESKLGKISRPAQRCQMQPQALAGMGTEKPDSGDVILCKGE
ncbi:hypothetical protein B0H13DRAFT_1873711 [Mycena leptocephala]|nr:hypothetical protein B0H13DRAFT_1873711 [Mycena leptocephala]